MMGMLWVVLLVALTGSRLGDSSPVRSTPEAYPHETNGPVLEGWGTEGGVYAAIPALALVITGVVLLFGCTWCYRHKDCKLFTASATHLHDARRAHPPDSGFSEPANNNISEANNNGPISLREMQNIANNNAAAYIVSENEERNRISRESVVEFEPLPTGIRVADPLERCADWFGGEDFPRNHLQYLREIGRGWFGRVVEGEIEDAGTSTTVAVKILNQNATLEDKARFLDEARLYRDLRHENVLAFVAKYLQEDPWILIFELCSTDLQQYLIVNRPKMAILNESGVPLRLMCDVSAALAHLHSRGYLYGSVWCGSVLVRGSGEAARGVLGRYAAAQPQYSYPPPEGDAHPPVYTASSDVWSLGTLVWEVCAWAAVPQRLPPPPPELPCPYRNHLYQVMQLCWQPNPEGRPTAAQVQALINHLHSTHRAATDASHDDGYGSSDFEERWQRLKPNTIPKIDEHVAIVHAPSTSMASHFTGSDQEFDNPHTVQDSLSVDMDTAVSRSSSIMSDKDPLSVQIKSESLTNLHGSLEDVRNIYLTHNETAALECHQGNISLEDAREKEQDRSDGSVDPWLKDIMAGSQDDVSYYKDVSDVIKNLDNILNSEKTSSSESSHQASPSRDNLSLDCKKDYPMQSSMVKSPGITNFQNILDTGFNESSETEPCEDDDVDRDTIGTLSHSFERHSEIDSTSLHTLENLTPDTPIKDIDILVREERNEDTVEKKSVQDTLPKEIVNSDSNVPKLMELCVASIPSASDIEQLNVIKDCQTSCDSNDIRTDIKDETKSIDDIETGYTPHEELESKDSISTFKHIESVDFLLPETTEGREEGVSQGHELKREKNDLLSPAKDEKPSVGAQTITTDLIEVTESSTKSPQPINSIEVTNAFIHEEKIKAVDVPHTPKQTPQSVQNKINLKQFTENYKGTEETEIPTIHEQMPTPELPPEIVQNIIKEDKTYECNADLRDVNIQKHPIHHENKKKIDPCIQQIEALQGPLLFDRSNQHTESTPCVNDNVLTTEKSNNIQVVADELTDFSVEVDKHAPKIFTESKNGEVAAENKDSVTQIPSESPEILCQPCYINKAASHITESGNEKGLSSNVETNLVDANIMAVAPCQTSSIQEVAITPSSTVLNDIKTHESSHLYEDYSEPKTDNKTIEINTGNLENIKDIIHKLLTAEKEHVDKAAISVQSVEESSEIAIESETVNDSLEDRELISSMKTKTTNTSVPTETATTTEFFKDEHPSNPQTFEDIQLKVDTTVDAQTTSLDVNESLTTFLDVNDEEHKELNVSLGYTVTLPEDSLETTVDLKQDQKFNGCDTTLDAQAITSQETVIDSLEHKDLNISLGPNVIDIEGSIQPTTTELLKLDQTLEIETVKDVQTNINKVDAEVTYQKDSTEDIKESQPQEVTQVVHDSTKPRSDILIDNNRSDSTVYMDLTNNTNNEALTTATNDNLRFIETLNSEPNCSLANNESTVYLDLPSFEIKDIENFLQIEKAFSSSNIDAVSSTPLVSDNSAEAEQTLEYSKADTQMMFDTKVPDYEPGASVTKLEQRYIPENISPLESPTKSHHTDTYDENSSVVLGPFENCTTELFKGFKSTELADIPKEELLAFSSNFSEINLETPSPLRDGNFLNEVPDIAHDDLQFDDLQSLSEKPTPSDSDSGNSATEKHISPSTPPNSPGIFLASTSQQKYLVDIDLTSEPTPDPGLSLHKEIELNQIELQITSKMAMAENENNLNLEYSGPLTVEGLMIEGVELREGDALPESFLAGNGAVDDLREGLTLDEECVKALRNELELKLPLAQVAAIEPQCENEWSSELPPPPELVVNYPGALSPIAEETGQQLSAYENDINWNTSTRTDSSESYPEPCNNSTDEVTELPTGAHSGREQDGGSPQSQNNTYTLQRDVPASSREITMSADSLNASPYKKPIPDTESPIDDKTYTKQDEEKESCERISQVSPFLLSPTTDTSAPDNSDNLDNATGVSTLSKTTLPTDAKLSKPYETQCLSKATSIDSWCSNDTLYNVEENFDDLAMDPEVDFEPEKEEVNSDSTDTLTHNEDEKEVSHCSTYIVHDSKSEACETFSPDSITANDNYTYTKVKTDAGTTPSATKSDLNDSKNTTKDLAYGTLMSGLPSYSNCTTEVVSVDDWRLAQPEMVRKFVGDDANMTPPIVHDDKVTVNESPKLISEPCLKKMDSVDISCLDDHLDSQNKTDTENQGHHPSVEVQSPNYNYKSMAPSVTSTPLTELAADVNAEPIPMRLPEVCNETDNSVNLPNFQTFLQSAEIRPQDLSSNISNENSKQDTEILLEGESKTISRNSDRDSMTVPERTPTYSDFESSAISKPQDVQSTNKSQSIESGISSVDFTKFENSAKYCPQDLSSLIDASSLLLKSERMSSEIAMGSMTVDQSSQFSRMSETQSQKSPPSVTNLNESQNLVNFREPSGSFLIDFDADDETEQPHSIIITETLMDMLKESPSRAYESQEAKLLDENYAYDSQASRMHSQDDFEKLLENKINGEFSTNDDESLVHFDERKSPKAESLSDRSILNSTAVSETKAVTPNGSLQQVENEKNGSEKFATVHFLNESFEELIESNVDDGDAKDLKPDEQTSSLVTEETAPESIKSLDSPILEALDSPKELKSIKDELKEIGELTNGEMNGKVMSVTQDFLQNEKKFCQLNTCLPLLSDIRFTGPATEIMSTSFTQDSPTEPTSPVCEQDNKPDTAADILKEWDSDTESQSSNSSSGEFIWKQRSGGSQGGSGQGSGGSAGSGGSGGSGRSGGSSGSGSGSEGDEVEFVPSSWDCRAAPAKSSLRSLDHTPPDSKKRVVFKRQKYHCVYEYPREVTDIEPNSPAAYLPDLSTYCEWDPSSAEEAELGYGQLFGAPSPLDMYPLRAGIAFGADYDEDFFISSSARPFESLGIMSTTSQFFPGKHVKPALLERDLSDDVVSEEFPPPPSPLPPTTLLHTRAPSLDFTTPDSGVEDITPGSTTDEDFKKKLPETELTWRPVDSASSSESVSPSSPGGEALGGLRHTRDKLKLDLPPSPHIPSPRHNRVFNFVLDKPKRRDERQETGSTPLVMTDETPVVTTSLPLPKDDELPVSEATFSTFGKSPPKLESEQKIILDEVEQEGEVKVESPKVVEAVKGEGTVLDSGDEDSGIESSSKATLERKTPNVS